MISPISLYNSNKEDKENMSRSRMSKEHDEKLERYDQLLDRIRTTDEQLQSLSRSWMNHLPVSNNYFFYQEIFSIYNKEFFNG